LQTFYYIIFLGPAADLRLQLLVKKDKCKKERVECPKSPHIWDRIIPALEDQQVIRFIVSLTLVAAGLRITPSMASTFQFLFLTALMVYLLWSPYRDVSLSGWYMGSKV
jgi:hypothetical protein